MSSKKSNDPRRGQRVYKGEAQSAINTYQRGERTVTLIGIHHMAEEDYYRQLRKRVDELETGGAVIQYEKGSSGSRAIEEANTDDERAALQAFSESLEARFTPYHMLNMGWQPQSESVMDDLGASWQLVDAGVLNIVRLFGPQALMAADFVAGPAKQIALAGKLEPGAMSYRMTRVALRAKFINRASKDYTKRFDDVTRNVMYMYRAFVFALAILSAVAFQDVVSISGPGHLQELDAILTRNGFTLTESEWVTSIGDEDRAEG